MFRRGLLALAAVCLFSSWSAAQAPAKLTAKLLSPISTKTSNVGDRFTALVESRDALNGAILEGHVSKLVQPSRGIGKGKPEIAFEFDSLTLRGRTTPISANLEDVSNSQGAKGVDEEGRVIGKTSNAKRVLVAAAITGAGVAIGAAAAGAKGAATGALLGGVVGLAISVSMTSPGSDIVLNAGSHLNLDVYSRAASR